MYIIKAIDYYCGLIKKALNTPDWVHQQFKDRIADIPENSIIKDPRLKNFRLVVSDIPNIPDDHKKFNASGDDLEFLRAVTESFYVLSNAYYNMKTIFDSIGDFSL